MADAVASVRYRKAQRHHTPRQHARHRHRARPQARRRRDLRRDRGATTRTAPRRPPRASPTLGNRRPGGRSTCVVRIHRRGLQQPCMKQHVRKIVSPFGWSKRWACGCGRGGRIWARRRVACVTGRLADAAPLRLPTHALRKLWLCRLCPQPNSASGQVGASINLEEFHRDC